MVIPTPEWLLLGVWFFFLLFFFDTGHVMNLSLESSDTKVYEPQPDTSPPLVKRDSPIVGFGRRGSGGLRGHLAHEKMSSL